MVLAAERLEQAVKLMEGAVLVVYGDQSWLKPDQFPPTVVALKGRSWPEVAQLEVPSL